MNDRSPVMLMPALIAGGIAGALAGLPYLKLVNPCTCCSFVIIGGFLASYLYSKQCRMAGTEFSPGSGALVGLIAGACYALAVTVVGTISHLAVGDPEFRWLLEWLQQMPNIPPESQDQIDEALSRMDTETGLSAVELIMSFFSNVLIGAAFSTVGGLIGGAVFKVQAQPPTSSAPPMPPGATPPSGTPGGGI